MTVIAPAAPRTGRHERTPVAQPAPSTPPACGACPHPEADHDAIALRFCRASEAQATTTRGCVCPRN
jgi:hypothetical protein